MASTKKSAATVDSHAKAYALLKDRLAALPEDETLALNADLELAATAGLVLVDRGRVDGRAELFGLGAAPLQRSGMEGNRSLDPLQAGLSHGKRVGDIATRVT